MPNTNTEKEKIYCDICGAEITDGGFNRIIVDGEFVTVCETCYQEEIFECENCGRYTRRDNIYDVIVSERGHIETWCEDCRFEDATTCENCGDVISDSLSVYVDGSVYCMSCAESLSADLDDYGQTEVECFYGDSQDGLFLGVELEVDNGDDMRTAVETIRESYGNFVACKHDGSLSDRGFEMASQPGTIDYHTTPGNPWESIFQVCLDNGFRSHDTNSCGLHVHVSRAFFDDDTDAIMKLWAIFDNNREWLITFSRRSQYHLDRWAEFKSHSRIADKKWLCSDVDWEKGRGHISERYQAINNTNSETIEFRLFRGTLNLETFYATLHLVTWLCQFVNTCTDDQADSLDLSQCALPGNVLRYYSRVATRSQG